MTYSKEWVTAMTESILTCAEDNPTWTWAQIAKHVGCSPSTVVNYMRKANGGRLASGRCGKCGKKLSAKRKGHRYCFLCAKQADRERKNKRHATVISQRYGITGEEYQQIYEVQEGKCAICLRATGKSKRLSVDHDHKIENDTGNTRESVRGLLCSSCNHMLGHGRDDPEFFLRAIAYLRNPPARKVLFDDDYTEGGMW